MAKVLGLPDVKVGRSTFNRPFKNHTTWNTGDLVVLAYDCNVTPGDSISIPIAAVVRTTTPLYPVMDSLYFDVAAYFVPDRVTWKHFKQFWGENDLTFWEQPTTYEIPQIEAPGTTGWASKSLADYLGIPTGVAGIETSHMPFRAYCKIWSDYYRDENLKEPAFYNDDDTTLTGLNYDPNTYDYTTDTNLGAKLLKVAKLSDLYTKALPEPQKGPDVAVPLGDLAPVVGSGEFLPTGVTQATGFEGENLYGHITSGTPYSFSLYDEQGNSMTAGQSTGLAVDLSNALGATVNELRTAIALQRYYEAIARSGSRYVEILAGIFGVESSDKTQQRAQFIGGKRFPLNMSQVIATAEGSNNDLGETGAMSQTIINDYLGTFAAEEHGTLMIVGCVRCERTYTQGIPKMLLRKKQTDFYNRAFDHLGEEGLTNDMIYAQGTSQDKEIFGYQPRYEDMRLGMSICTGEFRGNYATSLDSWTYQDEYNALPTLSSSWIDETVENVDRTLKVNSSVADQLFGDFYFNMKWTRGMSMYGTPGFMDHM